jgi:NLR family CARD domain-containing protein 3
MPLQELSRAKAVTGLELHDKFLGESDAFTLSYGGLSTFYSGLAGLIGAPSANLHAAVRREHCESADSSDEYQAPNYGTTTTPAKEYWFVVAPAEGLRKLGIDRYPVETKLEVEHQRKPRPLADYALELKRVNRKLQRLGCSCVSEDEFICTRL